MSSKKHSGERGYAMLPVVVLVGALLTGAVGMVQLSRTELHTTADQAAKQRAFYIAERGVQHGVAKLDQDRIAMPSSITTGYSATLTNQSFGSGTYDVSIAQDPVYPTDQTRKLITSVGSYLNQQATVTAHATVMSPPSPTICFTNNGTCTIQSAVALANGMFNADIRSNHNVAINNLVQAAQHGTGNVYAQNAFSVGGVASLDSTITGTLHSGVAYTPSGLCLPIPLIGLACTPARYTFSGGKVVESIADVPFPHPDYDAIAADPRTVIVRPGQVPSGTSWDSGTNTWTIVGNLSTTIDDDKIYYVPGNVTIANLQLLKGTKITIVARGNINLQAIQLVATGLMANSTQSIRLIAQGNVTAGNAVTGLSVASALSNTNNFFAYSETGSVAIYTATIDVLAKMNFNMIAWNDATLQQLVTAVTGRQVFGSFS